MEKITHTYESRKAQAESMLAKGFATKAARKDALEYVGYAFDYIRKELHAVTLAAEREAGALSDGGVKAAKMKELYWAVPGTPAHWNAKRAKQFAAWPEAVARADALATLREAIKAVPEVPKERHPDYAAKIAKAAAVRAEKDSTSKECQICGRAIFAEVGVVAHHGYERPGEGFQTASCSGARHLPYEASADLLPPWIDALAALEVRQRAGLAEIIAESVAIGRTWYKRGPWPHRRDVYAGRVEFTRATLDSVRKETPAAFEGNMSTDFNEFKRREVASTNRHIDSTVETLAYARARLAAWKLRAVWNDTAKKWESV